MHNSYGVPPNPVNVIISGLGEGFLPPRITSSSPTYGGIVVVVAIRTLTNLRFIKA